MTDFKTTVILFATSSHAIRAEKILKQNGVAARLTPVPRHLSSDCGLCVQVPATHRAEIEVLISENRFIHESLHELA